MTISPSSMTTMTRTSSHRTNRPLRPQTCKGMPALCRHFYSAEGTRRNRAAKLGSPRSRNQKSSGCKCKGKGAALALAASHLLLQLIRMQAQTPRLHSQCRGYLFSQPRNRKSHFFKKVLASMNRFRYSTNSLQQEATRVWRNWQTRTVQVRMGATP